ncbi:MAG: hypothetical protein AAFX02_04735 [Pseudomonadota bacterium]
MQLFLAMSCLQGRPMHSAFDELITLDADGIQLTPGNAPTVGFPDHVKARNVPTRTHQGYAPRAYRAPVWNERGDLLGEWDSVHPPHKAEDDWRPKDDISTCLEVMYPGCALGSGGSVRAVMDRGLPLAIDISHIFIQLSKGTMTEADWRAVRDYDRIEEIHVSANAGDRDSHAPIQRDTFGLDWARERAGDRIPVMLESYFHKLSGAERAEQIAVVRGTA